MKSGRGIAVALLAAAGIAAPVALCLGPARGGEGGSDRPHVFGSQPTSPNPASPAAGEGKGEEKTVVRPPEVSPAPAPPRPGSVIESPVPREPAPEAILLVSAHSHGWITPCGCPGVRAGGVARRAGYGDLLRTTFPGVSVLHLDLGGVLTLESEPMRITTDALIDAMKRMRYEAMNVAVRDLGTSLEQSEYLKTHLDIPRFSANVVYHDTGKLAFPPYRILRLPRPGQPQADPIRIGLIGLVSDQRSLFAFGEDGRSLIARPLSEALDRYLPEVRAQSDLVVVMAETPPDPFYSLLRRLEGIDLVVCGEATEILINPILVGGVPVTAVGNQGKYIAELRVTRKDGKLGIVPFVHWLDARYPEDPHLKTVTEGVLDRINESSRRDVALDTTPAPATAPYVGAEACAGCHASEMEIWRSSKHAHAMETLVALKRDYTVTCVMCHVTGFNNPDGGGFVNPRSTPHLAGVQCESCHGPAQAHIADPAATYGKPPEDVCILCHTQEQDPKFDRAVRWAVVAH